jgi:hypothetical protein
MPADPQLTAYLLSIDESTTAHAVPRSWGSPSTSARTPPGVIEERAADAQARRKPGARPAAAR